MRDPGFARVRRALLACCLICSVALLEGACGSDSDAEAKRAAAAAEGCLINTDCKHPLVCAFRRCHVQCETQHDCAPPQLCVPSDRPFKVCTLPEDRECEFNSDCPSGFICASDLSCRPQCKSVRDCVAEQTCIDSVCAVESELVDGGLPPPDGGTVDAGEGKQCIYTSDCPAPLVCKSGACLKECREDRDCAPGQRCSSDGGCVAVENDAGTGGSGGSGGSGGTDAGGDADAGGPPDCLNGTQDPGETGVDCGGPCGACATDDCTKSIDCASRVCVGKKCQAPSCTDDQQNGTESDVDCGGGTCPKCAPPRGCWTTTDCLTGSCENGTCTAPGCKNLVKDVNETDVDCGGVDCDPCANDKACLLNADCSSQNCVDDKCVPSGPTAWVKPFDADRALVSVDAAGDVVVAGIFQGSVDFGLGTLVSNGADVFLAKYRASGAPVWTRRYGGTSFEEVAFVGADASGDVLVVGRTGGGNFGGTPLTCTTGIFAAKYAAATGNHLWSRCLDPSNYFMAHAAAVDASGNLILGGDFNGSIDFGGGHVLNSPYTNGWLAKLSGTTGGTVWLAHYRHPTAVSTLSTVRAITAIADELYVAGDFSATMDFGAGVTLTASGQSDGFVLKVGANGMSALGKRFGDSGDDDILALTKEGQNLVVTGTFQSLVDFGVNPPVQSNGGTDLFVMKVASASLVPTWAKGFGGAANDASGSVAVATNGEIAVTGELNGAANLGGGALNYVGQKDGFLLRLTAAGAHIASRSYGGLGSELGTSVAYAGTTLFWTGTYQYGIIDIGTGTLPAATSTDIFIASFPP
jgi:hypothetical protein